MCQITKLSLSINESICQLSQPTKVYCLKEFRLEDIFFFGGGISFYSREKEVNALKVVQVDINWWCITPSSLAGTKAIFFASKEFQ